MYNYILGQWTMASVTATWVQNCVPKYITQEQCNVILATVQTVGIY
jgi:hypothetical protein